MAAAAWLRAHAPELRVRVVMKLFSPREHPHGMTDSEFVALFTEETHVVFSFHGYPGAIHHCFMRGPTRRASTSASGSPPRSAGAGRAQ